MKKNEELFNIIDNLPDDLIKAANPESKIKRSNRTNILVVSSVAATVAVCLGVNHLTNNQPDSSDYEINNNLPDVVSETAAGTSEPEKTAFAELPVSVSVSDKVTTVLYTESPVNLTDRIVSVSPENPDIPHTNAHTEQVQILETSVFTEAVKTEPVITDTVPVVSEPVMEPEDESDIITEPEKYFDLYENVIGSFGANAILLDYTKDSRAAMIINEDGSQYYLKDGGTKSIVKMKDGELPPEEEINEKLGCNSVKFSSNRDGSYTLYAGKYKEKVYELLENNSSVLSIDEEQIVYECDYNIESMVIKSDDSVQDIINNYPDLNLIFSATQVDAPTAPDYNPQGISKKYYCEIDCTPETYEALKELQDSGAEYHFKLCILDDNSEPYITNSKNIFQR